MGKNTIRRFVIASENFYADGMAVYNYARGLEYRQPPHVTGYRSMVLYQEPGMKKRFEKILCLKITDWGTHLQSENGIFFFGFSKGDKKETPGVHADTPYQDVTVLVYLTPGLPADCGTSFWQHKATGLDKAPTAKDAERLNIPLNKLRNILETDSEKRSKWIELDRIGYTFNKMIAFPSGILHSATRHYGNSLTNGRIFQTFRIGVDWSTFQK